jgi:hypothetical protein
MGPRASYRALLPIFIPQHFGKYATCYSLSHNLPIAYFSGLPFPAQYPLPTTTAESQLFIMIHLK